MKNIVFPKPSWVVHISHNVSLLQQQLWNILFAHAHPNLLTRSIHQIEAREVFDYLGCPSNTTYIKKQLKQLTVIVSRNIIDKHNKIKTDSAFTLLETVDISKGVCSYSFPQGLIQHLVNPPSFAKINLLMQRAFRSRYSLIIYEFCLDYAGVGRSQLLTVDDFRAYLGLGLQEYRQFKYLNFKIIQKAVDEINEKSDIRIEALHRRKLGQEYVGFIVKNKMRTRIIADVIKEKAEKSIAKALDYHAATSAAHGQLVSHGVSMAKARKITQQFGAPEIAHTIAMLRTNLAKVLNPGAWLASAFDKQWFTKLPDQPPAIPASHNSKPAPTPGAKKKDEFDFKYTDHFQMHRQLVEQIIDERYAQLSSLAQKELESACTRWIASQPFSVSMLGASSIYRRLFLEKTLLTKQEQNFETWRQHYLFEQKKDRDKDVPMCTNYEEKPL